MNKLSVENNESYRSERHATGFFFTLSIAKDNVLEMRVPWKTMSSSQFIHHLDELWLTKKKNEFGKIKDGGIKNYVRIKNNT